MTRKSVLRACGVILIGSSLFWQSPLRAEQPPLNFQAALPPSTGLQTQIEIVPPGLAASDVGQAWTLADLEAMALASNPTLAQAAARVRASRGNWLQVGLPPNPIVGYEGGEIGAEGTAGEQGAFIGQEFITGGKLGLNRSVASQEIRQAQQAFEAQRFRVLSDVRIAYNEVLIAQRALELSEELVQISAQAVHSTDELFQAQEVGRVDVLQARVEAESAEVLRENSHNRYSGAWRRLASVIGSPRTVPRQLVGNLDEELPELEWEEVIIRLLATSPEIAVARAGVDRARFALSRAQAEPIPNVDVRIGVQHDYGSGDTLTGLQVGVPLPVFNRNQGNIRRAEAQLTDARNEIERVELDLQNRLAITYERYANARNQVRRYSNNILPSARESLELVRAGYRQGGFSFLTLLTAQRTYFQTNLAYLDALQNLRASQVAIDGLLLTGSLQGSSSIELSASTDSSASAIMVPGNPISASQGQ